MEREAKYEKENGQYHTLTEEALESLIAQVEKDGLLRAPAHLKKNILQEIQEEKEKAKKRKLLLYQVKIASVMAAALLVLIFMPENPEPDTAFLSKWQKMGQEFICQADIKQEEDPFMELEQERRRRAEGDWQAYREGEERKEQWKGFLSGMEDLKTKYWEQLKEEIEI